MRLPFLHKRKQPTELTGLCCVRFDADGIALAYVRHFQNTKQLQWCEYIPWNAKDPQSVLSSFVKENRLEGTACSLMLQAHHYQLLPLEELPVPKEEFQSAVRWKIKSLLPYPVSDAVIDSFVIYPSATAQGRKHIMVVAARASELQTTVQLLHSSGLDLKIIDIPELAYRNITALYEKDEMSTALIYLHPQKSDLVITRQKSFCLSRHIDWDVSLLLELQSEPEQAQGYLDGLALELQRSFDYYQSEWRYPAPTRILLSCLSNVSIDITAYLAQRLALPIQNLDLGDAIVCKQKPNLLQQARYLPVIGGALRDESDDHAAN